MTGLARIGEEVEGQFELWAPINGEKAFWGGERESVRRRERDGEWRGGKMTSVCCKEFLDLRVVRTCATIWSISNPWATFTLMRLTQDGEVGRGRLGRVEGECRGDEAGGGGHAVFSSGPPEEEASKVSRSTGKSWETCRVITYTGGQHKYSIGLKV